MKVMILTNNDMGLYKFRKEMVEEMLKDNDVYVCLPFGEFVNSFKKMGCKYIPLEFNRRSINPIEDLKLIFRYIELLKQIKPDVILSYTIKPNAYGGFACQVCKVPYIVNVTGLGTAIENGGLLGFISTMLYKVGLRKASCVFFQNEKNRVFIEQRVYKGKTRFIPGAGVNLQTYRLEKYPNDENGVRFLFVGRIMKDKGIEELLEAIRTIHKEYPDVILDIVGVCDEDYSESLKIAESDGYVRYHGSQPDARSFYVNCHCTVLPSYHEGTANAMLESSATGRPVITTRVPGCMETFDEGITGFGCEAKSTESLVEAMRKFLNISHEERERMGRKAREKMEKEYDRKIVIDAYLEEINLIKKTKN